MKKRRDTGWAQFRRFGNLGIELVVAVFVGGLGGHAIDRWFHSDPLFLILGFFVGVAAGFLNCYRLIASEEKMLKSEKRDQKLREKEGEKL